MLTSVSRQLLEQLREEIWTAKKKPDLTEKDFAAFFQRLHGLKVDAFGSDSPEARSGVQALSEEELEKLGSRAKTIPLIHGANNVTRIIRSPGPTSSEFYRKRIGELADEITSLLLF